MVVFNSASLFPARKQEAVTQGGTKGIDHPTQRKTEAVDIVKGWEGKRKCGYLPDIFT